MEGPKEDEEPLVTVVWNAMEEMLQHCQRTVKQQAGYYIRMEVVRSEVKQTKYRPLQPYMDPDAVKDYARPWKQIVVFFVRTQQGRRQEEEGLPPYELEAREQRYFNDMFKQAKRIRNRQNRRQVRFEAASEVSGEVSSKVGRERSSDMSSSSDVSSDGSNDPNDFDGSRSSQVDQIQLKGLPVACLRFCLALLGRRSRGHDEYELPMLCAMALLGIKPGGWRNAHEYPPIMSQVIKMARFMVIQQAYQQAGEMNEGERPDLLKMVTQMVDKFMIRGSQGAMQWVFDRRAYGMKIHYTSTAEGNVDWVGNSIRYKQIEFSMDQLRSMVHGLVYETYRALERVLYTNEARFPAIPWTELRDDPTREGIGHSFVQDERNPWPVDGATWLADRLIELRVIQQRGTMISAAKKTV